MENVDWISKREVVQQVNLWKIWPMKEENLIEIPTDGSSKSGKIRAYATICNFEKRILCVIDRKDPYRLCAQYRIQYGNVDEESPIEGIKTTQGGNIMESVNWKTKKEVTDFINAWLVSQVKEENIVEIPSDGSAESREVRAYATVSEGRVIVITDKLGSLSIRTMS